MNIPTRNTAEFAIENNLYVWGALASSYQSVIIRDIVAKATHHRSEWDNVEEFVLSYIEVVSTNFIGRYPNPYDLWSFWGELLYELETGR